MNLRTDFFSRKNIIRVIGTLLSITLLIYLLSQQGWTEIVDALRQIPPINLVLVVILMTISRISVGARWYSLLRSTTSNISFAESLRMTFAGLFAANFLPTTIGGDVVRLAGTLPRTEDRVGSAASIAADRLVGLSGMAMAIPLGLGVLIEWIQTNAVTSGLFLHLVKSSGFAIALAFNWSEGLEKFIKMFRRLIDVFAMWIRRPRALIVAFGFTWLHMACLFSLLWLLLGRGSLELHIFNYPHALFDQRLGPPRSFDLVYFHELGWGFNTKCVGTCPDPESVGNDRKHPRGVFPPGRSLKCKREG